MFGKLELKFEKLRTNSFENRNLTFKNREFKVWKMGNITLKKINWNFSIEIWNWILRIQNLKNREKKFEKKKLNKNIKN